MSGIVRKGVLLVLLTGGAALLAAYFWGPQLTERFGIGETAVRQEVGVPSPELADSTLTRLEAFESAPGGEELHLGEAELSSVVRYSLPGILPAGVSDPTVQLRDGRVLLGMRVALAALPDLPALRDIRGLLPDTILVELDGTLAPLGEQHAALHVDRVEASKIPIPSRLIPDLVRNLGPRDVPGLLPNAIAIPLPRGLAAAYVRGDTLVLVAK